MEAPRIGTNPLALSAENTMFANFSLPAISVPAGFDAKGRPWEDYTVLDLANTFLTLRM